MTVPAGFQFSQSSLQDYVDCHRRFQLRYLLQLAWPAIETEPVVENERYMQQGARFHRLVQQHLLGIPADRLEKLIRDDDLERWWRNYLQTKDPAGIEPVKSLYPEINLSASLGKQRLVAKYDLIAVSAQNRLVIVDWKTARKRPQRKWLAERLQTRLYPSVLVLAGAQFVGGGAIQPDQIEMVYWFADFPDQPERFSYSQKQFEKDRSYLEKLLAEIERRGEADFDLTSHQERCAYCVYRSLCDRGVQAGDLGDFAETADGEAGAQAAFDFEQIAEIEF